MNTKNLKDRGFTLIELMITMVMLSIIVVAIVSVVMSSQKAKRNTELISEAQQTARILVDMISDDVRSAGYGANTVAGHTPIVYAAPYDIMISANLAPYPDVPGTPGSPAAINPASTPLPGGSGSPLYDGGAGFADGAETIRYTFDSNNDKTVTTADRGDDLEERLTRNDELYSVTRQVFGFNATANSNGGNPLPVGLARSDFPAPAAGVIKPLFQYWISTAGGDVLHGDTDNNGSLSDEEIDNLTPVPAGSLRSISRVIITVTTATKSPNSKGVYEQVEIATTTTITRNIKITEGRVISGKVAIDGNDNQKYDSGETGIPNIKVENRTDGQVVYTDANGDYSFAVEAKKHTIEITLPTLTCTSTGSGFSVVDSAKLSYLLDATTSNVTRNFSLEPYTPGYVSGVVFEDLDGNGIKGSGELGIPGCTVYLKNSVMTDYTDSDGNYCIAAAPGTDSVKCIVIVHDPEYTPTIPNPPAHAVTITSGGSVDTMNFGFVTAGQCTLKGKVYLDDGNGAYNGEAGIAGVELAVYYRATAATPLTSEQWLPIDPLPLTASDGTFAIKVAALPDRYYSLTEIDPKGYFSTTTNRYDIGFVTTGQVVTGKNFGDMKLTAVSFSASNVLSMTVNDFREYEVNMATEKNDTDIVLGTKYESGRGNIRGWFNKRYLRDGTQTADVTQLFELGDVSTTRYQYAYEQKSFPTNVNIQAIASDTMNHKAYITKSGSNYLITTANVKNSRHRKDLVLGLSNTSSITYNVAVWPSMDTCKYLASSGFSYDSVGAAVIMDSVPATSPYMYKLIAGGNSAYPVNALAVANFGSDGYADIIAGFSSATNTGGFQMWINTLKIPSLSGKYGETRIFPDSGASQRWTGIGEVLALDAANIVGTASTDLVVGTRDGTGTGSIIVYTGTGTPSGTSKWFLSAKITLNPLGEVTALKIIDINNDGKKDIVAAVRTDEYVGMLQVWLQEASGLNFGMLDATSQRVCSYFAPFDDAEPVCLDAALMKWYTAGTTPHIVVGLRSSEFTGKTLIFDCSGGVLPEVGSDASGGAYLGAVAAVKISDFSMDGRKDIAVADKNGVNEGRLIIYYAQ
ncbi:MAG: prepilin-type N-terminal cleavage/methylation domain-containing protein [bacterium]|nr:prepilin-type N-terminal cleavage/methylation domain-containing protein [bacterium]